MIADPSLPCFIDTNILVYAYDRSAGEKHRLAVELLRHLWEDETGCLSLQVLQEFHFTVTCKIANPLDLQTARLIVSDLSHWRLHTPEVRDLLSAIDYQLNYQLSFWDALIVLSAARLGCQQLLSEDLNHGQSYSGVQVINPFLA
jgi:predicted nucleic acid-binding protein